MNPGPSSPEIRISDTDRETALTALGEHMSAGRLDIDEYGERSAKVTAAKTRGDLAEVFTDLPEPHPTYGEAPKQPAPPAEVPKPGAPVAYTDRPLSQRLAAAVLPVAFLVGLVLFFTVGGWWWFALPLVLGAVGQRLWGRDWDKDPRWREERDRRRDLRDRRRH
ncbi:DUF1707 domain-containing protein [Amycolatopsis acidicola]|uniref:DUF1707 domain-containing protein n=1 Tax=Amycolatopsis acidicola TaxID=2596893 RepID=A0A5N0UL19_9PSEU|nr:DUF1707 domain-containing protein [Amycolatopsis acidicola]KAA9150086.1 DUF1707 domain-containing protein [Amycolatopsis acidicola]